MRRTFLLLIGVVLVSACERDGVTPTSAGEFGDIAADNISVDVRFYLTHNGIRKALVVADTAYLYQEDSRTDLRMVEAIFFSESGEETGRLTSREGMYDMAGERFTALGDAVLDIEVDGEARQVESEELHYSIGEERLWSDMETRMEQDGRILYGSSFESDVNFRNPRIREPRSESGRTVPRPRPDRPEPSIGLEDAEDTS